MSQAIFLKERGMTMRLDKFLADVGIGSRKEIKQLLKKKVVTVNGDVVKEAKTQVNEETDQIALMGEILTYQKFFSPKKHVDKEYLAEVEGLVTVEDCQLFAQGFALKDGEMVKPSRLVIETINEEEGTSVVRLVIQEGKFHQVKRMLATVGKPVTYLKRLRMGELWLDETLELGEYRPLTEAELQQLQPKQSYLN